MVNLTDDETGEVIFEVADEMLAVAFEAEGEVSQDLERALTFVMTRLVTRIVIHKVSIAEGYKPGFYTTFTQDITLDSKVQAYFTFLNKVFEACQDNERVTLQLLQSPSLQAFFKRYTVQDVLEAVGFIPGIWMLALHNKFVMKYYVEQGWFTNQYTNWKDSLQVLDDEAKEQFNAAVQIGFWGIKTHCVADISQRVAWYEKYFAESYQFLMPNPQADEHQKVFYQQQIIFFIQNKCFKSLTACLMQIREKCYDDLAFLFEDKTIAMFSDGQLNELAGFFENQAYALLPSEQVDIADSQTLKQAMKLAKCADLIRPTSRPKNEVSINDVKSINGALVAAQDAAPDESSSLAKYRQSIRARQLKLNAEAQQSPPAHAQSSPSGSPKSAPRSPGGLAGVVSKLAALRSPPVSPARLSLDLRQKYEDGLAGGQRSPVEGLSH